MAIVSASVVPRTNGPAPDRERAVRGLQAKTLDDRAAGHRKTPPGIEPGDRGNRLDRRRTHQPERTPDVLRVHHHLTQPRRGGPRRRSTAGDDLPEPPKGLGRTRTSMLGQPPIVVQIEVEPCPQYAGEPPQRPDARRRREMRDDLLHRPPPTQRPPRPLRLVKPGKIISQRGTFGMGGRPQGGARHGIGHNYLPVGSAHTDTDRPRPETSSIGHHAPPPSPPRSRTAGLDDTGP
jgi:hypothetical protein